jgi:hypothetical protein
MVSMQHYVRVLHAIGLCVLGLAAHACQEYSVRARARPLVCASAYCSVRSGKRVMFPSSLHALIASLYALAVLFCAPSLTTGQSTRAHEEAMKITANQSSLR